LWASSEASGADWQRASSRTLQMFGMKPLPGVRLSLISEASDRSTYSGMIPMWQVFAVEQPVTLIYGY
jgi:hypothetical protein